MEDTTGTVAVGTIMIIYLTVLVLTIVGCWKVYTKANQPGWACIIPIYNIIVWLQIVGRPLWWIVLLFIPIVSFVIVIILCHDMARSFGKGAGYGIGIFLLPFIFLPMLGFGDAQYQGLSASS